VSTKSSIAYGEKFHFYGETLEDVHRIDVSLAELRTEVRDAIVFSKWAGTALVGVLVALGSSGFWWTGRIDADVRNMGARYDERFKAVDTRFDKLEAKVDARFDKVEASIGKLAE
jgi:hypothetical protein